MKLITQSPQKSLRAFLKHKVLRAEMDIFKANLLVLLDKINVIENRPTDETEEHLKNDLRDFLRDTYYRDSNAINTKDKKDLVIHLDKTTNSEVGVIIEAKRPTNVGEMITAENSNKKALHELILYYLDERNKAGNFQLKHLVITNINEWYIIDANDFDKYIYNNTQIKNLYKTKTEDHKNNPFFYQEIEKIVAKMDIEMPCVYFDIRQYDAILRNNNKENDRELIALFKILSPQHLLKITTLNDSNSLNEPFYRELLHVMGLEEIKDAGKNIICRKSENRHKGSILELAIDAISTEDLLHKLPNKLEYGQNHEEQIFSVALELCITWINRILFLKLLEGQLKSYHNPQTSEGGNSDYATAFKTPPSGAGGQFLNTKTIPNFDELFKLFHKVLAVDIPNRTPEIQAKYAHVPYLNSSLFEISELEDQIIKINGLDGSVKLEFFKGSVAAPSHLGRAGVGFLTLDYLFRFLDNYDFASEGSEDIQDEAKALINASVLGKVFEKINGYKDGSVFTPAYITMYMCRESIRRAVIEKFQKYANLNKLGNLKLDTIEEIYEHIFRRIPFKDANEIINSLKICDPAVGSGHFLVSALNEIIAIKSELGVLIDENEKTLRDINIEVIDDELDIRDENNDKYVYNFRNKESSRIQKTLFHEKQTIIENCLFGVDINPNSVKICRLRLWIELLKNTYYKSDLKPTRFEKDLIGLTPPSGVGRLQLETLPNIDINIKCGNSLLSRFSIDADLSKVLKSVKFNINTYRGYVNAYKNEKNREVKRGLQKLIDDIKTNFRTEIAKYSDPRILKLQKLGAELFLRVNDDLFNSGDDKKTGNGDGNGIERDKIKKLEEEINTLTVALDTEKNNTLYRNAFEWRFEFPEVLSDNGDFEGFDLVVGNPPYIMINRVSYNTTLKNSYECYEQTGDVYLLFFEMGLKLMKEMGNLSFITSNKWLKSNYGTKFRNFAVKNTNPILLVDFNGNKIFDSASVDASIFAFSKEKGKDLKLRATQIPNMVELEDNFRNYILENEIILE
ncbi:MAG: class I SAM-dependent DNA methyltransferase, partial [Cytophagales bacterium]